MAWLEMSIPGRHPAHGPRVHAPDPPQSRSGREIQRKGKIWNRCFVGRYQRNVPHERSPREEQGWLDLSLQRTWFLIGGSSLIY